MKQINVIVNKKNWFSLFKSNMANAMQTLQYTCINVIQSNRLY